MLRKGWVNARTIHVKQRQTNPKPTILKAPGCSDEIILNCFLFNSTLCKAITLPVLYIRPENQHRRLVRHIVTDGFGISTSVDGQEYSLQLIENVDIACSKPTYKCCVSIPRAHLSLAPRAEGHDRPAHGWSAFRPPSKPNLVV